MRYDLKIWCEECTKEAQEKGERWYTEYFYSLSSAIAHYMTTAHEIQIALEAENDAG